MQHPNFARYSRRFPTKAYIQIRELNYYKSLYGCLIHEMEVGKSKFIIKKNTLFFPSPVLIVSVKLNKYELSFIKKIFNL